MNRLPRWVDHLALAVVILSAILILCLTGCSQQQVDRAEQLSARANEAVAVAGQALRVASDLAAATGSKEAQDAVAAAKRAFDLAAEAAQRAEAAGVAAKKEQAAGGGTIAVIGAAILASLGGWSGAMALAGRAISKYKTALTLTAHHADVMEEAEDADDVAYGKDQAHAAQVAAGVADLIAAARGKAA